MTETSNTTMQKALEVAGWAIEADNWNNDTAVNFVKFAAADGDNKENDERINTWYEHMETVKREEKEWAEMVEKYNYPSIKNRS